MIFLHGEKQLYMLKKLLTVALYGAKRGSMDCDISNLALALILYDDLPIEASLVNLSGCWEDASRDYQHSILNLGNVKLFQVAIKNIYELNFDHPSLNDFVFCDLNYY